MDQIKIGNFIQDLRKEKKLTQEKMAEQFGVTRRTVSRWGTGTNLPDLDLLIELADFFEVDLREILDGGRKTEKMNKELEETVHMVADYSNAEKEKLNARIRWVFLVAFLGFAVSSAVTAAELQNTEPFSNIASFAQGFSTGMMFVGLLMTSRFGPSIRAFKKRLLKRA